MTITQPNPGSGTSADSSSDLSACLTSDDLKQYISGWCDDADAERIESHLATCRTCEQALQELEIKPDTLLQSLQGTTVEKPQMNNGAASDFSKIEPQNGRSISPKSTTEQPIDAALAKVRQLMDAPAESAKPVWQPANRELGVYELLRPLGRGGMGAVYLANHRQLHKQVAIKLLPVMSAEDSDVRVRFQREIRVVGKLNHPSIVAATDAGEIDGTQFLVMEYVPGMDLSRLARLLGKLPVADACELMRQVALGLSCAHAEGVVHRDVKPSNLMLDESGRIRILDFGLAQLSFWDEASIELTTVGQLMGTLDYMAPEQAELCGGVDYRADLYAMGATLFRLLCGRPPLAAAPNQSPLEKLRLLANHQPPKLDTLCPEAPPELVKLVASLLARSPQGRPASAAHVAEELAEFTESANLVTLLQRAQEKEAQSPEPIASDRNRRDFIPAMVQPAVANSNGRGRIRRWIIAAVLLPLVFVAGIFIKLETEKGQLVIESEVADVKVRIINDGKPVGDLNIKHGTTATRLRADKYEIIIDGQSDGLTIDNNQFTLKNGETVVARVRLSSEVATSAQNSVAGTKKDEPLYEGKTLDEWLEVFSRERSPTGLKSAFDACSALVSPATSDKITQTLLKWLPLLDGNLQLTSNGGFGDGFGVDFAATQVLLKANPGPAYYAMWVNEFEKGDEVWRRRLWQHYCNWGNRGDLNAYEPFVAFAERRLSTRPGNDPLEDETNQKIADVLRDAATDAVDNPALVHRTFLVVKNSAYLKRDWWLSQPRSFNGSTSNHIDVRFTSSRLPIEFQEEVVRRAVDTLEDGESSLPLVAQSCMILAKGPAINDEQRLRILKAIDHRLESVGTRDEALTAMVPVAKTFGALVLPGIESNKPPRRMIVITLSSVPLFASPILEMLDLVGSLNNGAPSVQNGLRSLTIGVRPTLQLIDERRDQGSRFGVFLDWPKLKLQEPENVNWELHRAGLLNELWGTHEPTSTDWLKFCIIHHPVLEQYLADHSEDPATTTQVEVPETQPLPPSENHPVPSNKVPLYEGRTLTQWLDVIQTERSPEQFYAALKACSALTTSATSKQITETLLKVIPAWDRGVRITINETPLTMIDIDIEVFRLLAKANPGRSYFELIVTQYQNGDSAWHKTLPARFSYGDESKFENVEPLLVWAEQVVKGTGRNPPSAELTRQAAMLLRIYLLKFPDTKPFSDAACEALQKCPDLGPDWWLAAPWYRYKIRDSEYWPGQLHGVVIQHAIDALKDPATNAMHLTQACIILSHTESITPVQYTEMISAANQRMIIAGKSQESLVAVTDINFAFGGFETPQGQDPNVHIEWKSGMPVRTSVALMLLNLYSKGPMDADQLVGLEAVSGALGNVSVPFSDEFECVVRWPGVDVLEARSRPDFDGQPGELPQLEKLPPSEWVKVAIYFHPTMVKYRDHLNALEATSKKSAE